MSSHDRAEFIDWGLKEQAPAKPIPGTCKTCMADDPDPHQPWCPEVNPMTRSVTE